MQKAISKLYHIPFWLAYHYLWWVVAMGNPWKAAHSILFSPYAVKFAFYVVLQAVAVYFNLYYLIPKYLEKGRLKSYIGYLGITLLATALAIVSGYYVSAWLAHQSVEALFGRDTNCFFYFFGEAMPSTLASTTLAMSIKLTKNWIRTERRKQLLEKEKLETELRFLKYQFNPHFLFNSINSIFFLIHKNPDAASSSLAKFSELLRHHLYECNDELVPLDKEIAYLHNFIALEKLRQNSGVTVVTEIPDELPPDAGIAPFILMTFVENAFKHVSKDRNSRIEIRLQIQTNMLELAVSNSSSPEATRQAVHYGGIGLKNVQRRLALIYPGLHNLAYGHHDGVFQVNLRVELSPLHTISATQSAFQ
ncbi:sensor histidine kinase [Dyadobacter jiangsuensis]|uniref:GHKL domain-containing protein n=1 Tax=Dyadobacter jiangsuensis TaxID=1591085 RepID=A0A2P8FPE4_9BACT|nr:histidine kinase [Dyadobacter jiangsuensis]PSL23594.1 GHKL domain-containing protein [Dyadobacter jiangsuensis]